MTKIEFMDKLPYKIDHDAHGEGTLRIVADNINKKAACYAHFDNTTSYSQVAENFGDLYIKMKNHLVLKGHLEGR